MGVEQWHTTIQLDTKLCESASTTFRMHSRVLASAGRMLKDTSFRELAVNAIGAGERMDM